MRFLKILLLLQLLSLVVSIAPPPPDSFDEYRRAKQRRLLKDKNSTIPKLKKLSPEICHGLSKEHCLQLDGSFTKYTTKTRTLIETTGVVKTLVLCVRFTDHADRVLPTKEEIEALWNAPKGEALDIAPTGSISHYLRENSYGKMQLSADVIDWTLTDNTEEYYAFNISGKTPDLAKAMHPVLRQIDALGIDFSQYDLDGDGVLDSVVLLHSGHPAEDYRPECYTGRKYTSRIWAHAIGTLWDDQWTSFDGRYRLGGYMVSSAIHSFCGSEIARIGVMTHELIHTWGLPDLYDTHPSYIGRGIGSFGIMGNPYGLDGHSQLYPSNMSPWSKMQSGWLEPLEITQDGEYTIEASAISPSVFIIRDKFPDNEYLLIENRQPLGADAQLWGGGLLIWHIDDYAFQNSNRGYPGMPDWPGNGAHYQVAIAAADRNYDLEKGTNFGDQWDFWTTGQELSPGPFENEATDYSQYPNTNSYMFGSIWPTRIRIYDISSSSTVMTFKVQGLSPEELPTPNPSWSPTPPPTPLPTWTPSMSPTKKPTPTPTTTPTTTPPISPLPTTLAPSSIQPTYTMVPTHVDAKAPPFPAATDAPQSTPHPTELSAATTKSLFIAITLHLVACLAL